MNFNKLIPELSVTNITTSIEFYTSIGFKIIYERKEDKFAFLELEGNQIMIEQINDNWNTGELQYPFGREINISMTIDNIDEYYSNIKKSEFSGAQLRFLFASKFVFFGFSLSLKGRFVMSKGET